jgi:hypothetical protein
MIKSKSTVKEQFVLQKKVMNDRASKIQDSKKPKICVEYSADGFNAPKPDPRNQNSEDFHLKLRLLTSEAYMIVHRQLCDGILEGWNQDPAYTSHPWGALRKPAFPSSLS